MSSLSKKIRFFFRLLAAFLAKYYVPLLIGLVFGVAAFIVSPKILPLIPRFRPTQTIALVGRFTQSDIPISIQQKISLGLTTITPDNQPAAGIATSWKISDDGKTYTFEINSHLKWQDGSNIKSRDINYHFKDTDTQYPDDTHLVIKLKDPFSPLLVVLSRPIFKKGLLGMGSYKVTKVHKNGQSIEFIILSPTSNQNDLPKLKYFFYPSEEQARLAFKLGVVNALEDIQNPADLSQWPSAISEANPQKDRYVGIFFNNSDPYFQGTAGKNLRQSLAYAVDKSRWPNRAFGPFNPSSWAYNPDVKPYDYDITKAKQLLSKVDKVPEKITISSLPLYLPVAQQISHDWEALGIHTDIQVVPDINPNYSVLIIAQAIPTDPDQYNLWHSTQSTNLTHFNRPRADKLLEDGRKTSDLKSRKDIYFEFQKFLVEETPVIFLFHPISYSITRP